MRSPCLFGIAALWVVGIAKPAFGATMPAPIRDDARLYSAETLSRAEKDIDSIRRDFDRAVFVQTLASPTPGLRPWYNILRTPKVYRSLEDRARRLADETGQPGIYVVLCRRPRAVQIVVLPDDEALRRALLRRIREGGNQGDLLAVVQRVRDVLHERATRGSSPGDNEVFLLVCLGGGIAVWLVLVFLRWRTRAVGASSAADEAAMTPALLGAMFGCPTGAWISDKSYLLYAHIATAPASPTSCCR